MARRTAWTVAREIGLPSVTTTTDAAAIPDEDVVIELAWDGIPVTACRVGDDVRLFGTDLRDWSASFASIVSALRRLPLRELALHGWVVATSADAKVPSFDALTRWVAGERTGTLAFAASDLLHVDDEDLRIVPLAARRERLEALLGRAAPPISVSQALPGKLADVRASVAKMALPGLLVRRRSATYPMRPGDAWVLSATTAELPGERSLSPPPKTTNADKVLYPRDGLTKSDIVAYYKDIAPLLLAHLRDRPIVAQRWPDGIDEFTWYQHRVPPRAPDYLKPVLIEGDRRIVVRSTDALLWLVNQAALTFHGWSSRVGTLDEPDWVVLDLDPGESTTWAQTVEVARAVRRLLELLDVASVLKTSGKRGLHVLVPLAPGQTMELAQSFARKVALLVARLLPDVVTVETDVAKRGGRLFFDHLNFKKKSLVLPYALRDVDGASVSAPLGWDELDAKLDPRSFNLRTMRARLDAVGDRFATVLAGTTTLAPVLARM
jgi:DNA ligase D-like protein (predicted polymerase)